MLCYSYQYLKNRLLFLIVPHVDVNKESENHQGKDFKKQSTSFSLPMTRNMGRILRRKMLSLISYKEVHAYRVLLHSLSEQVGVKGYVSIIRTKGSVHRCCSGSTALNREGRKRAGEVWWV